MITPTGGTYQLGDKLPNIYQIGSLLPVWIQLRTEVFEKTYEVVKGDGPGYLGEYFMVPGFSYIESFNVVSKHNHTQNLTAYLSGTTTIRISGTHFYNITYDEDGIGRETVIITVTGY